MRTYTFRDSMMTGTMLASAWPASWIIATGKASGQMRTTLLNTFAGSW